MTQEPTPIQPGSVPADAPDRGAADVPSREPASAQPPQEHSERNLEHRDDRREGRRHRPRLDSFEKMKVWQEAHALALKVFAVTPQLPQEQQAGLALQMEQAAVAVPRTIAAGFRRRGPRNKAHYYNLAQTELESLRYYFILCRDLGYQIDFDDLAGRAEQISRMLDGLVRSMAR